MGVLRFSTSRQVSASQTGSGPGGSGHRDVQPNREVKRGGAGLGLRARGKLGRCLAISPHGPGDDSQGECRQRDRQPRIPLIEGSEPAAAQGEDETPRDNAECGGPNEGPPADR